MNWWDQMGWIVAAAALVITPIATYAVRRLELRDERVALAADADLYSKLPPNSPAALLLARTIDLRVAAEARNWMRLLLGPEKVTKPQLVFLVGLNLVGLLFCALAFAWDVNQWVKEHINIWFLPEGGQWWGYVTLAAGYGLLGWYMQRFFQRRNTKKAAEQWMMRRLMAWVDSDDDLADWNGEPVLGVTPPRPAPPIAPGEANEPGMPGEADRREPRPDVDASQ
jgi:hypothetical protein